MSLTGLPAQAKGGGSVPHSSGNHATGHESHHAGGGKAGESRHSATAPSKSADGAGTPKRSGLHSATGVKRDADGKIHRSAATKVDFKKTHPCPSTGKKSGACPGYVIDHVRPLKRGGEDSPSNMQWQTTAAAKAKDATE